MKQKIWKRIVAGCLLLITLLASSELPASPLYSEPVQAEAATHTHADACYQTTTCGTYVFDVYECSGCYDTSPYYGGTHTETCNGSTYLYSTSTEEDCGYCGAAQGMTNAYTYRCYGCNYQDYGVYEIDCWSCGKNIQSRYDSSGTDRDYAYDRPHETVTCGSYTYSVYYCSGCNKKSYSSGTHTKTSSTPTCDRVVTGLTPTVPSQVIVAGQSINTKATATFLNGTSAEVNCTVTGYNDSLYNTAQTVTFSYGEYKTNANTAGPFTVTVSITVQGEFKLTVTSEDTNKGTVSNSSGDVMCNASVSIQAYPNTGHSFAGWYSGNTLVSTANPYTFNMPAADTAYVAKFTINKYTLTAQSENTAFGTVSGGGSINYGTSTTVTASAKTGYKFAGWHDGATLVSSSASYTFKMPAKNYTLTAKFTALSTTASFNVNGGSVGTSSKTIYYNNTYGTLPVPTRSGYVFLGWFTAASGGTKVTASTVVKTTTTHTLYAQWGQTGPSSIQVIYDRTYPTLPSPVKEGYIFNGWFWDETTYGARLGENGTGTQLTAGKTVKITDNDMVHSKWSPVSSTITLDANGGVVSPTIVTVTFDKYWPSLPIPTWSGHTFLGWYFAEIDNNGTGDRVPQYPALVDITSDTTIYAKWSTNPPSSVDVTYNPNGGTFPDGTTVKVVTRPYPGTYAHPANPTRQGYEFAGWLNSKGDLVANGSSIGDSAPHTLTAKWNLTATPIANIIVRCSIDGVLYPNPSDTSTYISSFDMYVNGELKHDNVSTHTYGYSYESEYYIADIKPKTGYTVTSVTNGEGILLETIFVTINVESNSNTITLDPNGGVNNPAYTGPFSVTYGKTDNNDIKKYEPSREGYTFSGWDALSPLGTPLYESSGKFKYASNYPYWTSAGTWKYSYSITAYARWNENQYVVSFDVNATDAIVSETNRKVGYDALYEVDYDSLKQRDFPIPERPGHKFTGWYTSSTGGSRITSKDVVKTANDHTLYAHWDALGYTVALDQQGATEPGTTRVYPVFRQDMPTPITLPKKYYTVTFDGNGGAAGAVSKTAEYIFSGYYTKGYGNGDMYYTGGGTSSRKWDIPFDSTLYAYWTGDGSITLPTAERVGYIFNGWYTEGGDSIGSTGDVYVPAKDETLYARWAPVTTTVTFNPNGGVLENENESTKTVTYDEKYGAFPKVNRSGYTFAGWYTSAGGGTLVTEEDIVKTTADHTLYAHWDAKPVTLNINTLYTYDAGCKEHETCTDNKGYTIATFDVYINGALKANNVSEYIATVSFDDTYEIKDIMVNAGYQYNGSRIGYEYNGYKGKDLSGKFDKDNYDAINGNVYVWLDFNPKTYTGTVKLNSGIAPTGSPGSYNLSFHQSWNTTIFVPTRIGYTFLGWFTSANGGSNIYNTLGKQIDDGTYWNSGYWHYPGNVDIHAQWSANKYNLSYDLVGNKTGASTTPQITPAPPTTATYDVAFTVANPTRVGYTFLGWNISGMSTDCTHYYGSGTTTADTITQTKETVFKNLHGTTNSIVKFAAQWQNNTNKITLDQQGATTQGTTGVTATFDMDMPSITKPVRKYTVTFNANTGICGTASDIAEYTFDGYYTQVSGGGAQYYTNAPGSARKWDLVSDTTLYAKWTSDAVTLPTPTKLGYTFQGWYTAASGGTLIGAAGATYTPTADITLYAQWKAKEYEITLNGRGATSTTHTKMVHMTFDKKGASITPPTKTGYTFHGYYTGTRGSGTKYYNASGVCVKEWTEDDKTEIYAYWTQDAVILPDEGDRTEPTPLPELDSEGSVGRTDIKGLLYADDYDATTGALTDLQPYLTYDTSGTEGVIPGTEKIAFRAKMGSWILHYKLHRNTGTDYVRFYVTVPYRTQYEQSADEELVISSQQTKTYNFIIPKVWSYWEILESGMYYPDKVMVSNTAIKGEKIEIPVDRSGNLSAEVPSYSVAQYGKKENHVFWEEYDTDGYPCLLITIAEEQYLISDVPDTPPAVDEYLSSICLAAAQADERQAQVRSDRFVLSDWVILSDEHSNDGNGAMINSEALDFFASSEESEETSYLQTYVSGIEIDEQKPNGKYTSLAEITYIGDEANINAPETITLTMSDVNDLNIHTPVVCNGVVADGMEKEEDGYVLTLKDAWNFFTLYVDNTGTHRMSFGYGTRDFSVALSNKSNVAEKDGTYLNQVQFPFDVTIDVDNDSKREDGSCNNAGDITLAAGTWLTLGTVEQQFYVPVTMKNGEYQIKFRTIAANCPLDEAGEYIVTREQYHANLDPSCYVAADVISVEVKSCLRDFNITSVNATAAAEQLKNGCQALTLKKGYGFSFEILTQGEFYGENAKINIVPGYFWESKDGTERQEVKLYHLGEFPQDKGKECFAWEGEPMLLQYENHDVILQSFKGDGLVPADVLCVAKDFPLEEYAKINTFTGREEFFLREGYLIIHFDVTVQSNEGVLYVFDKWENTELAKNAIHQGWNYMTGDIIRYDLSKSIVDDYEIGGSE